MSRMKVSHEDFVTSYVTSKSLDEVVKTTGMTKAAVQGRAGMLRKKGVNLPRLGHSTGLTEFSIAQLNSLVKKYSIYK